MATYQDLVNWRNEARNELNEYRSGYNASKSRIAKVEKVKKGTNLFAQICKSGLIERIVEKLHT